MTEIAAAMTTMFLLLGVVVMNADVLGICHQAKATKEEVSAVVVVLIMMLMAVWVAMEVGFVLVVAGAAFPSSAVSVEPVVALMMMVLEERVVVEVVVVVGLVVVSAAFARSAVVVAVGRMTMEVGVGMMDEVALVLVVVASFASPFVVVAEAVMMTV